MHPMAYVDGVRGVCSVLIVTGHCMDRFWGWIPPYILDVPGLQFLFRGGYASLNIFFWISGYTITYKLSGLMQRKRTAQFFDTLTSAIFRRYTRLFLPALPVTLLSGVAVRAGLAIAPGERVDRMKGNLLWWWIKDSSHLINPYTEALGHWNGGSGSELLEHTWSLVTEFRSSMIIFAFCAGTFKISTRNRKRLIWVIIVAAYMWQMQWSAQAFLGMWFSECRQERQLQNEKHGGTERLPLTTKREHLPNGSAHLVHREPGKSKGLLDQFRELRPFRTATDAEKYQRLKQVALLALFCHSFIVLKDPYDTDKKTIFPHNYLNMLVPDWWDGQSAMHMHLGIGIFFRMLPLDLMPALQRPLLTPFVQYLGELSFGIYVVHMTVKWIVWDDRYIKWLRELIPERTPTDYFSLMFPGWLMMLAIDLWAADLFRRVDMQVVKFGKWLEDRMFEQ